MSHVGPSVGLDDGLGGGPRERDGSKSWKDVLAAYVGLTKPRVIELLLLTTVPVLRTANDLVATRDELPPDHRAGELLESPLVSEILLTRDGVPAGRLGA